MNVNITKILRDPALSKELVKLINSYPAYRLTYRNDPEAWVHDVVDWRGGGPAFYQVNTMADLAAYHYLAERGPRGIGKTTTLALLILWFSTTRDVDEDWKLGTTASNWRQLTKFLWPEVHKWAGRLHWDKIGRSELSKLELLTTEIKLTTGMAFAAASDNSEALEGAHADSIFYIFDESKLIPNKTWDSIEGTFMSKSSGDNFWLAVGTPGAPKGRFYDIHRRAPGFENWHTIHVTLEDGLKAGRISRKRVEQLQRQWGKESSLYKTYVLGEFAGSDEELVIPLELVEKAINYYNNIDVEFRFDRIGVDVGWGGDRTVLAFKKDDIITKILKFARGDTMATVGRIKQYANKNTEIVVDVIGIGAGVYDKLKEDGYNVIAFNAAAKTNRYDKSGVMAFANKRAAAWWALRERLEDSEIGLPDDDDLIGDLTAPRQLPPTSNGAIRIEPKDKIKLRIGRSTDAGDAVVMAFFDEAEGGYLV